MIEHEDGQTATAEIDRRTTVLAAEHWGKTLCDASKTFYCFPPLRQYLYSMITGQISKGVLERDWVEKWTIDSFLQPIIPVDECLSLCCGFGEIERILASHGVFKHCTGIDGSIKALEQARKRARSEGYEHIEYRQANINQLILEPRTYDLIWANGALHHLTHLEHVTREVYKALKPGGFFIANEYIGPKHQQLDYRQREIINAVIHLIPPRYRQMREQSFVPPFFQGPRWKKALFKGAKMIFEKLKPSGNRFRFGKVWDVSPWHYQHIDPSEGVRSDEIVPILKRVFQDIDIRYYHGSILLHALDQRFFEEFDPSNPEDQQLLNLLTDLEKTVIEIGEVGSDHAHIIARKGLD